MEIGHNIQQRREDKGMSQQDLADYLAIDRCAMTRELKYLKEEGFISVNGRVITLLYSF